MQTQNWYPWIWGRTACGIINSDESLNEYIQFRFTINSIMMDQGDMRGLDKTIREVDRQWLAYTFEERMKLHSRIHKNSPIIP